jgi:hypothetical protein
MTDIFTLLRQAAKDGTGYVNLPLLDKMERDARQAKLCSDCPPPDYPTDKTRCLPCPRRSLQR